MNSPLLKAAVNGNDPNVGRLLCAVGKVAGAEGIALDPDRAVMRVGGETVLEGGAMRLEPDKEQRLVAHLRSAELYASAPPVTASSSRPSISRRTSGASRSRSTWAWARRRATVLGADLSHEYVSENADYRS